MKNKKKMGRWTIWMTSIATKKINIKLVISSMMQFFCYDGSKLPPTFSEKVIIALYSCKTIFSTRLCLKIERKRIDWLYKWKFMVNER